ncbi:MAG TPA: hypothetical protein H9858_10100 [Candidatus Blautia stercoravium]|nr:hypothetical protein [Candidatus Blautia stercoravium]
MKGRKQVLTWTFLSVFLLAQTTIFGIQGSGVQPKEQGSAEDGLERGTRPAGHALVHRDVKYVLYGVKKGKDTFGQQAVWQQAGARKKTEEVCSYGKQDSGWMQASETGSIRSTLRAPPFLYHSEKGRA